MANGNLPPPNPRPFGNQARDSPFDFSQIQGAHLDMSNKYFEKISKFSDNCTTLVEDHIDSVWAHMEACGDSDEDVYMRGLFVSLEGEARRWFDRFSAPSIDGYDAFVTKRKD